MRSLRQSVATATVTANVMRQLFHPISHHELNMFRVIVGANVALIIQIDANHVDQRNDVTLGMWKRL